MQRILDACALELMAKTNMAEEKEDDSGGLYKGSIFPVTVEEALKDVLVVCLKHGSNTYRGVLMDSTKSKMPYGLGFDLLKLQCVQRNPTGMTASLDHDNQDKGAKISALSLRHSYQQDENSTDTKLLPTAHVGINRPLGGKNVRSMRLRPRQVLCSKCKNRVQDSHIAVSSSTSSSSSSSSTKVSPSPVKITLPVLPASLNPEVSLTKLDLRKRRFVGDFCDSISTKKIKADLTTTSSIAKTSPVIKISFASPRGRGTIVKIPAKIKHENNWESDDLPQKSQHDKEQEQKEEYKKLKKALKKAKLKEKESTGEIGPDGLGYKHHHKKSKRNKHKAKKKKRHKDCERPADDKDQPSENHSDFENDQVSDLVYTEVKEPDEKEEWSGVNDYLENGDTLNSASDISLKENSQNVPLKGKISRTFTSLPIRDDRPSFESSRMSTSSGNSDHSSEYDMNSDSDENDEAPGEHVDGTVSLKVEEDEESGEIRGKIEPLMVRIKTKTVTRCLTQEGRTVCIGDVVWGKIHGFPWWPGRVTSISVSQREGVVLSQTASVSWFGSSTMSIMPCSEIHPFLQDFELRYNKKKKGPYKTAIRQACSAAQSIIESPADKPMIPILED